LASKSEKPSFQHLTLASGLSRPLPKLSGWVSQAALERKGCRHLFFGSLPRFLQGNN
jgi:hypothetical protein